MRVFCPEHKRGFFAPRQSPVKCENRGHILGELDFEGLAKTPIALNWQYCCNCEHFCPIEDGIEHCPVCTRRSVTLYLCDRCYTISFESDTPLQTKNFTLSADGVPQPSCPACLHETSADLREHTCEVLQGSFVTALNVCPICQERLDVGPTFPATVATYLRRTRSKNKVHVTFDYETGVFVPVGDGEFVLVTGSDDSQAFVLPRAKHFVTKRDFYEFYQDYYHCSAPDAGEVEIIQPAQVTRSGDAWALAGTGMLRVILDKPKKTIAVAPAAQEKPQTRIKQQSQPKAAERPSEKSNVEIQQKKPEQSQGRHTAAPLPTEEKAAVATEKADEALTLCTCCDSYVDSKYTFCWQCGSRLSSNNDFSFSRPAHHDDTEYEAAANDDEELTVQHEPRGFRTSTFNWGHATTSKGGGSNSGRSVLKLLGLALLGLILGSLALFAITRSAPETVTAKTPESSTTTQATQPVANEQPNLAVQPVTKNGASPNPSARPEDEELARLREKRLIASASDQPKILQTLARTERRFPNDYRFPYERAKLALKTKQPTARKDAFEALSHAAMTAIKTGKANEMLDGLETDKAGDFQLLARNRHEWTQVMAALKTQDTGRLGER